jgi:hypothetical protein
MPLSHLGENVTSPQKRTQLAIEPSDRESAQEGPGAWQLIPPVGGQVHAPFEQTGSR